MLAFIIALKSGFPSPVFQSSSSGRGDGESLDAQAALFHHLAGVDLVRNWRWVLSRGRLHFREVPEEEHQANAEVGDVGDGDMNAASGAAALRQLADYGHRVGRVLEHIGANHRAVCPSRQGGVLNVTRVNVAVIRPGQFRPFRIGLDGVKDQPAVLQAFAEHALGGADVQTGPWLSWRTSLLIC